MSLPTSLPQSLEDNGSRNLRNPGREDQPPVSAKEVFADILHELARTQGFKELVYTNIEPEHGALVCRFLEDCKHVEKSSCRLGYNTCTRTIRVVLMTTKLHDVHQRWVINASGHWLADGLLSEDEYDELSIGVGTTFRDFTGRYIGSVKQPDLYMRAGGTAPPAMIIESGWAESFPLLRADKELWMIGKPLVEMVILLKWTRQARGRVKGDIEVWRRDGRGGLEVEEKAIFPEPSHPNDRIEFTKHQIYKSSATRTQNPTQILSLDLNKLRKMAEEVLVDQGKRPA
ncbi:hypothetical protein BO70DRAFT_325566 [Aspergillus heteromorphus CBS 117.55]|uniref:Uncharacterized protein n=1 Tax=Aspergillus heteromorphus CBS 117.55 TaxID=1448321 RepID=A0A317UVN2_9EURO|nr:uncharacterized protein BO70DRAFT_325566 [Aspergillus heteromorphus CBS 117.55]PWY64070.1 hypothetical protein BO70DRAFT_325566 [Aspergillus heteromorphus CBS 117.55]